MKPLVWVKSARWRDCHADLSSTWLEWRNANLALASPFFHPDFSTIVAQWRNDVEVGLIHDDSGLIGIFPFQRLERRLGVPVGHFLSDYHGIISDPDFFDRINARELIKGCGLIAWDFDHLVPTQRTFAPFHEQIAVSAQINTCFGFDQYLNQQKGLKSEFRKLRRLEEDHGPVRFVAQSYDEVAYMKLLEWKSAQYRRTGVRDILKIPWVTSVLRDIHLRRENTDFQGVLSLLYAGDRLTAAHLGLRSGGILHHWFPSYDPEFSYYSPGLLLLLKMVECAPSMGIHTIDLGTGLFEQKRRFMNASTKVVSGSVQQRSLRSARRAMRKHVRSTLIAFGIHRSVQRLLRR
jgi:CelD/BcsL family acetyltransferase involved in cellulose biosynthesis